MFIDDNKLQFINNIIVFDQFSTYRDYFKIPFEPFINKNLHITVYEEILMMDFIYYYIHINNIKDFKLYYLNTINDTDNFFRPIFYVVADRSILDNNLFNNQNIKAEVFGALLLNILFPLLQKNNIQKNNNNISFNLLNNNIEYIKIINGINIDNLKSNNFSFNNKLYMPSHIQPFNYNKNWYSIFEWDPIITPYGTINLDNSKHNFQIANNEIVFGHYIYNLIHSNLLDCGSILFELFKSDFIFYIKCKDSSNLIISNIRDFSYSNYKLDIMSDIDVYIYNNDLRIDDFIVEFNYYNIHNNIQINNTNSITINNDQLFKYNNIIKPWARENIYPKINNFNIYRYSGISFVKNLFNSSLLSDTSNYQYYLNMLKKHK